MTSETTAGPTANDAARARKLFTLTIFVGSFLLFLVQPMVARMALPRLGGAPAVWNSAMLVYQALLLAGYAWAHWLARWPVRRQLMLHGGLLAVAALVCLFPTGTGGMPMGLRDMTPPADNDVFFFVPMLLLASIGPLLIAISAQAPLMQRWFTDSAPDANPYALYAASNLGSFGGLIAYPLVVEPNLHLASQSWGWSVLYLGLVALVVLCGRNAARAVANQPVRAAEAAAPAGPRPGWRQVMLWIALSAVPSGLMLSTTTHLTTDIMAMPLMWAIPLGLYLLSFSVAFSERRWFADFLTLFAPSMLLLSGGLTLLSQGGGSMLVAVTSIIMLFAVATSLHSRLYRSRPENAHLTFFYLVMSVGGALGGVFCALIAPLVFDWVYEHPLLIVAAALLIPMPPLIPWASGIPAQWQRILGLAAAILAILCGWYLSVHWTGRFSMEEKIPLAMLVFIGLMVIGWRLAYVVTLVSLMVGFGGLATIEGTLNHDRVRSYFGVYTVRDMPDRRTLSHGTTLHGTQLKGAGLATAPTSYYGPNSGVGLAFSRASQLYGPNATVGVVGLGSGTLACYRRPGQQWQFFEIDPAMIQIARDSGRFTYFPTCGRGVPIHVGDARLKLQEVAPHSINLLAIDAFSSDAIPLHLLTQEAFDVYDRAVTADGVVLVHISNRFVNLEPVLLALVEQRGWHAQLRYDDPTALDRSLARTGSIWVAMARNPEGIERLVAATRDVPNGRGSWRPLATNERARLWTDDYASVLPLLMRRGFIQ